MSRRIKEQVLCHCGCGRLAFGNTFWTEQKCRLEYCLREFAAQRMEPTRVTACKICGTVFCEFDLVSARASEACSPRCRSKLYHRKSKAARLAAASAGAWKIAHKSECASNWVRENYCWRRIDNSITRIPCLKHKETCGNGCYKEKRGKPCCYVEGFKPIPYGGVIGIDTTLTY